jgi:hypothetical protein
LLSDTPRIAGSKGLLTKRENSAIVPCLSLLAGGYQEKAAIDPLSGVSG